MMSTSLSSGCTLLGGPYVKLTAHDSAFHSLELFKDMGTQEMGTLTEKLIQEFHFKILIVSSAA